MTESDDESPAPPRSLADGARSIAEALAVVVLAGAAVTALSIVAGISTPAPIVEAQAIAPTLLAFAYPLLALALVGRRWIAAVVAGAVVCSHLALCVPAFTADDAPSWVADAPTFTLHSANLRFDNADPAAVVDSLMAVDADVIVLNELVPAQLELLDEAGFLDEYPIHVASEALYSFGEMILTRLPATDVEVLHVGDSDIPAITVRVGDARVRVLAAHPSAPPLVAWGVSRWTDAMDDLRAAAEDALADGPVVIAGDMNATTWHRPFADLLDLGLADAHDALGAGLSPSWGPEFPGFDAAVIRLDHCLTSDGVSASSIDNGDTPGSDHLPFDVTLAVRQ